MGLTANKKVGVVVISYNGKELLEKFLPKILVTDYNNFEVYVIDNASTDGTGEYLASSFPEVRVIRIPINKGFTNGYVEGLAQISNEYYVLVSSDIEVSENWIQPVINLMESDFSIAACQPKIKSYDDKKMFEYSGSAGGFIDYLGYPFCRGRMFFSMEEDKGQYDDSCKIFWASGTAFLTRKNIFNKLGGFDELFFAHMEEIDYHWKCQLIGYEIWVEPKSEIYHHGGFSLPSSSPQKTYLNYRNSLIVFFTNNNIKLIIKLVSFRIILDIIALIKELFILRWMHAFAIIKSWIWVLFHPQILLSRKLVFDKINKQAKIFGIFQKSIVFEYFLKRKYYYNDIFMD